MNLTTCQPFGAVRIAFGICLSAGPGRVAPRGPAEKASRYVHVMRPALSLACDNLQSILPRA
eukprot:9230209-Alexandrium_andersonii.AAC.1